MQNNEVRQMLVEQLAYVEGRSSAEIQAARDGHAGLDNPFVALPRILGSTRVYHRIARDLYDRNLPELMAAYSRQAEEMGFDFGDRSGAPD